MRNIYESVKCGFFAKESFETENGPIMRPFGRVLDWRLAVENFAGGIIKLSLHFVHGLLMRFT